MSARAALAVLLAALVGACGGAPDPGGARTAVTRFLHAMSGRDVRGACAQLSSASRLRLADYGRSRIALPVASCEATLQVYVSASAANVAGFARLRPTAVRARGTSRAEVTVAGLPAPMEAVFEHGAWRVDAAPGVRD